MAFTGEIRIKIIALIEKTGDFSVISKYAIVNHLTVHYIALTPIATAELESEKIPHTTAMDYPGHEERLEEGFRNFSRINSITDVLDEELVEIHKIPTIHPAQYPFYYLKNLFDVLSSTVLMLNAIIDSEKPEVLIYCIPTIPGQKSNLNAFTDNDSVFAEVLTFMKEKALIQMISLNRDEFNWIGMPSTTKDESLKERLIQWIRNNEYRSSVSFAYNIGLVRKKFGNRTAIETAVRYLLRGSHSPVLIYEYGYDWDDMLPHMIQEGFNPVIRLTDHSVDCLVEDHILDLSGTDEGVLEKTIKHLLLQDDRFQRYAVFGNTDLSPLLFEKMAVIISHSVRNSIRAYRAFEYIHKKIPIKAVLLSVHTHSKSFAVVQAAHDTGAKVISWQHGGAGYTYQPLMPYIELFNSDYHFVYGEGVKSSYQNTVTRSGFRRALPEIIPVGSTTFDKMKNDSSDDLNKKQTVRSVLYITSNYYRNGYYVSQPTFPIEYDIHLWKIQKTVLDLARHNPDCNFTIKLHPTHCDCQPLKDYANLHQIANVKFIVGEKTLVELARSADIILFDLVSTGILQAMTTKKPIFVYGGAFKIGDGALRLLTRRAYYSESIDEFTSLVNNYISGTIPSAPKEKTVNSGDLGFLNAYGTQSSDGKSAERALAVLNRILIKSR